MQCMIYGGYRALTNHLLILVIIQPYGSEEYVVPTSQPILGFALALAHITWGTPLEQGRQKTVKRNLVWDPHSLKRNASHHVTRPMCTRSWVPQAPGPV